VGTFVQVAVGLVDPLTLILAANAALIARSWRSWAWSTAGAGALLAVLVAALDIRDHVHVTAAEIAPPVLALIIDAAVLFVAAQAAEKRYPTLRRQ
jgi:hypothetical protein